MDINLTYMSGAGNLFSVIDNRKYNFSQKILSKLAPLLCSEGFTTDGLLAINKSNIYDFEAEFYNPDGSTGVMCGNGGRCSVFFAGYHSFFNKTKKTLLEFSMAGDIYKAKLANDSVSLFMPAPIQIKPKIKIDEDFFSGLTDYINVNTDHIVINYSNIKDNSNFFEFDLVSFAKSLRYYTKLFPNGTNVNVYFIDPENKIHLRTYERGVEAETGACGTGAAATAISIALEGLADFPVEIIPKSKSKLRIDIAGFFPDKIHYLILEGNSEIIGFDIVNINYEGLNQ